MTNVNDDRNCIVGWTIPLRLHVAHLLTRQVAYSQFGSENRCYRPPYVVRDPHFQGVTNCLLWICTVVSHTPHIFCTNMLKGLGSWATPEKAANHTAGTASYTHQYVLKHRKIKSTPSVKPAFRHPSFSPSHSASLSIYFHQSRRK